MATLLELKTIELNSLTADPETATGDVLLAMQLRQKIEAELWIRASSVLTGNLPTDLEERNNAIAMAQRVASQSGSIAAQVLKLVLAANAGATVTQILGASDAAISTAVGDVIVLLAKGMHPGR